MNKAFDDFLWENYPSTNTPLGKRLLNKVNSALRIIDERVMQLFNIEIPTIKNTKLDVTEAYKLVKGISLDEDTGIFTITFYDNTQTTIDTMLEKLAVNFDYYADTQKLVIILSDGTQKEVDLSALITQYEFLDSDTIYFDLSKKEEKAFEMEWSRKELLHLYSGNSMTQKTYQSITVESELPITEITAKYVKPNESDFVIAQIKDISGDSKMFFVDFPGGGWKWTISLKTDSDIGDGTKKVIGYYKKIGCVTAHIKEGSIEEKHLRPDYLADIKVEAAKADSSRDSAAEKAQESAESALMSKSYSDGTSGIREGEEMDNAKYYSNQAKSYYENLQQSGNVTGVKGNAESSYRTGNVELTPENIGLGNVGNFKAVSTMASQGLSETEKTNARTNIGAAPTSHASTATTYGASSSTNYGHAMASSTTPKANGTAAVGSETTKFARGDHVHPLQTSVTGNAATATKLAAARTIRTNLASTSTASFDGSANITPGVSGVLPIANGGTGNTTGNAPTATKATNDGNGNNIANTYETKAKNKWEKFKDIIYGQNAMISSVVYKEIKIVAYIIKSSGVTMYGVYDFPIDMPSMFANDTIYFGDNSKDGAYFYAEMVGGDVNVANYYTNIGITVYVKKK